MKEELLTPAIHRQKSTLAPDWLRCQQHAEEVWRKAAGVISPMYVNNSQISAQNRKENNNNS